MPIPTSFREKPWNASWRESAWAETKHCTSAQCFPIILRLLDNLEQHRVFAIHDRAVLATLCNTSICETEILQAIRAWSGTSASTQPGRSGVMTVMTLSTVMTSTFAAICTFQSLSNLKRAKAFKSRSIRSGRHWPSTSARRSRKIRPLQDFHTCWSPMESKLRFILKSQTISRTNDLFLGRSFTNCSAKTSNGWNVWRQAARKNRISALVPKPKRTGNGHGGKPLSVDESPTMSTHWVCLLGFKYSVNTALISCSFLRSNTFSK